MTQIGTFPSGLAAGQPENVADVVTALNQIKTVVNGNLDTNNLSASAGVTGTQLAAAAAILNNQLDATTVLDKLGLSSASTTRRGKTIIATTESRTNTAYGTLTTPDRVSSIVLPTDGLIAIAYQATWQESVQSAARAAIFIGATQLKYADQAAAPAVQEVPLGTGGLAANNDCPLATFWGGLAVPGAATPYTGDVTSGQVVGARSTAYGGPCYVFAAAGTYDITVQFKASSGSVTAKNRKLWVWTLGF